MNNKIITMANKYNSNKEKLFQINFEQNLIIFYFIFNYQNDVVLFEEKNKYLIR